MAPSAAVALSERPRTALCKRLVVALDLPTVREAEALADKVADLAPIFKIGHQLAYTGGLALADRLIKAGREVFLDLKLHDIPRTVEEGVRSLAGFGASFLTVHAYPQTMRAALAGRQGSGLKLLGVTVLTSMDEADAKAAGYGLSVPELVAARAADAGAAGIDGIVCAASEIALCRDALGPDRLLVVPGIRPPGASAGDQKRVMTPDGAIRAGADHLVVGRPITGAQDALAAARAILRDMETSG